MAAIAASDEFSAAQLAEVQRGAKSLRYEVLQIEVRGAQDIERVVAALRKWQADSILVLQSPINFLRRKTIGEVAAQLRLPSMTSGIEFAEAGLLLA